MEKTGFLGSLEKWIGELLEQWAGISSGDSTYNEPSCSAHENEYRASERAALAGLIQSAADEDRDRQDRYEFELGSG